MTLAFVPPLEYPLPDEPKLLVHPSGMSVELIDSMGGDIDIVNAARVSLGKESWYDWVRYGEGGEEIDRYSPDIGGAIPRARNGWEPVLNAKDHGLLNYLLRERHGSPFEMVVLKFRVVAPIGVIWEWVRHRIASYNIMSTRYVEWERTYYTPQEEEWRQQIGKVGAYEFSHLADPRLRQVYVEAMESAFDYYGLLVDGGLAKEVARNVLPMGSMTQMIWCVNLRSLMNFLSLRNADPALREIRICAEYVEKLTEIVVPETLHLWNLHGRHVP